MIAEVSGIEPDAAPPGAARGRRRAGARGRRAEPAELPPRAAARGDVRRPAPGRAQRAPSRARARVRGARPTTRTTAGSSSTSAIARHYATAGDQPAACARPCRPRSPRARSHAYGDAADLAERALELWPRVPDADQMIPLDHVELLGHRRGCAQRCRRSRPRRGAARARAAGARSGLRAPPLLGAARRACLASQWSLNRGNEAIETAERALSMLPPDEISRERASLLAWVARTRHLRGRYRDALSEGEAALATAVAAGDRRSESEVLNTLGMTQIVLGEDRRGHRQVCAGRSRSRARTTTSTASGPRTRTWLTR